VELKTMATSKKVSILKPNLAAQALKFASGGSTSTTKGTDKANTQKVAQKGLKQVSGLVPNGDVRLTANIREDLHLKLKIHAAEQRTTIGEVLEQLLAKHL
jgi:hypothetical protein